MAPRQKQTLQNRTKKRRDEAKERQNVERKTTLAKKRGTSESTPKSVLIENQAQQQSLDSARNLYLKNLKQTRELNEEDASEEIGKIIVSIFKNHSRPREWFSKMVSEVRSRYPTDNHINKFVVGLSCEYLFTHALTTKMPVGMRGLPIFLCSDREKRNDVYYWKGHASDNIDGSEHNKGIKVKPDANTEFGYSIKYQSASDCMSLQSYSEKGMYQGMVESADMPVLNHVKMINNIAVTEDSSKKDIDEDVFIIVSDRRFEDTTKKDKSRFNTAGKLIFIPRTHYKYMWGADHKPYEIFYQRGRGSSTGQVFKMTSATVPTTDGAVLRKEFLNHWMRDPANKKYWTDLDIPIQDLSKLDPVFQLLKPIVGSELETSPIFLCRRKETTAEICM